MLRLNSSQDETNSTYEYLCRHEHCDREISPIRLVVASFPLNLTQGVLLRRLVLEEYNFEYSISVDFHCKLAN